MGVGKFRTGDLRATGGQFTGDVSMAGGAGITNSFTTAGINRHNGVTTFGTSTLFLGTVPTTITSAGTPGQFAIGLGAAASQTYLYVCYLTNTWARLLMASNAAFA